MASSRHHNLNNPAADPTRVPLEISCSVHFNLGQSVPKQALMEWFASLPDGAKIKFQGVSSGKAFFEASWKEER